MEAVMKKLYVVLLVATATACMSIQAAPVQVGDRCLRCRQSIGDVRLAGEIIDRLKAPFPFRTAGCLAKYLKAHPAEEVAAVFVADNRSGRLIAADAAWFVPTVLTGADGRTKQDDYVAFRSRADADRFRDGRPLLRWPQVLAETSAN
jgi:hypothetical protein